VTAPGVAVDLFAGPGGWSVAARALGVRELGIELDAAACETRAAAGHPTVRADVAEFPLDRLAGKIAGLIGSPPCKLYSAAGTGIGRLVLDLLAAAIPRVLAGDDCRAEVREQVYPVALGYRTAENDARAEAKRWTANRVAAAARSDAFEASLVLEPARYIAGIGASLRWVALEQVPAVLPLWQVYARELRKMGFSAWCGKLNSADYGVPQTRERAILIASRGHQAGRPEPTHYDPRKGMQLWGTPWVSMADALGWGMTGRPYFALCAAGGSRGGADEQVGGSGARHSLYAERDADRWILHTNRDQRPDGSRQTADPRSAPAPAPALTAKSGGQWAVKLHRDRGSSCDADRRDHPADEPALTITSAGGKAGANLSWVLERPSATVQGDPRIGHPGHKDREGGESQFAQDSVRISVAEAAVLQSFPPDYPWQGSKTAQFQQVGNAVPPLLALHVLSMTTGIPLPLAVTEAAA
jgi:DNA (cytosine-5)-methyltransferase 1